MTDLSILPPLSPLEAIRSRVELQEVLERVNLIAELTKTGYREGRDFRVLVEIKSA
jgi:hypothetical protein